MDLETVLRTLGETDAFETVRPHWAASVATLPRARPSFLDPAVFKVSREWGGLGAEAEPLLTEAARRVVEEPALLHLCWHCHQCLFEHSDVQTFKDWPSLEAALEDLAGAFYLLVCLDMAPRVRALHRSMGVAEEVARDTCRQIWCVAERYRYATRGRIGMNRRVLYWFRYSVVGDIFRIGRFEYMIRPFRGGVVVYRHGDTNEVLALADDGVRFDREGYVASAGLANDEGCWTASLTEDAAVVAGFPVSPFGMGIRRQVTLPRAVWERALGREHEVLQMHIPGGGGMTPERCAASMRGAVEFFRRHFPQKPFAGIVSRSWIFNTQLQQILPAAANLVRYQRELYLFPTPSGGRDGLYFIFCRDDFDEPSTLPRDTSLQGAVADFLATGRAWRGGGMFMLNEDVPHFGTQYYQSRWPPRPSAEDIPTPGSKLCLKQSRSCWQEIRD